MPSGRWNLVGFRPFWQRVFEWRLTKTHNSYFGIFFISNAPNNDHATPWCPFPRTARCKKWYLCATARAFDINGFFKLHFCVCPATMVLPTAPLHCSPVALGRLIAETDIAEYHKSYTNSRATETIHIPRGTLEDRRFN